MKKLGLIGKNIEYSFSRAYFSQKFSEEKITNYSYENIDLIDIDEVMSFFEDHDYVGFNVTIPYKQKIIPFLDELSPDAKKIGAVNTIVRVENRFVGHNTDWIGFWKSIQNQLEGRKVSRVLIIGNGGAASAVKYAFEKNGVKVEVAARTLKNNNEHLLQNLNADIVRSCQVVVHTTPVGTHPNIEEVLSFPFEAIGSNHLVVDLIYNPEKTRFLQIAEEKGARIINGYGMLVHQAEEAWRLWCAKKC